MKISLEIIHDHIKTPETPVFFRTSSDALTLGRPVFYTREETLKSHTLYIARAEKIKAVKTVEKGAACICIGQPSKRIMDKVKDLLVFPEEMDFFTLSNEIHAVFDRFDQWENALLSAASSNQMRRMYQQMLDTSSVIFENGLSIMDNMFRIIFQNKTNIEKGGYENPVSPDQDFSIPAETLAAFKFDKEYQRISEERNIFYYEGETLPHRVLCKNIFQEEEFLFRIIITECVRPFRKSDEVLLEFLSAHFEQGLHRLSLQNLTLSSGLSQLLSEAIETGHNNRPAIESELRKRFWSYTDTYRVISIHVSADDLVISTLNYYSYEASRLFPESCSFPFHDSILVVINESRIGALEHYSEALGVFVRENNFRIGISNFTDDIYQIQILYRQAEMALSIGLTEKPMEWIHWFSRYTLQYIYNMLTDNSDLGQLYSPIYYRLERYDKENGTSYLETLREYLNCNMNTVQAAKNLFIQRSTMIYRLKRIREISDNDLTGRDDLLHLHLTFSIIDRKNQS